MDIIYEPDIDHLKAACVLKHISVFFNKLNDDDVGYDSNGDKYYYGRVNMTGAGAPSIEEHLAYYFSKHMGYATGGHIGAERLAVSLGFEYTRAMHAFFKAYPDIWGGDCEKVLEKTDIFDPRAIHIWNEPHSKHYSHATKIPLMTKALEDAAWIDKDDVAWKLNAVANRWKQLAHWISVRHKYKPLRCNEIWPRS